MIRSITERFCQSGFYKSLGGGFPPMKIQTLWREKKIAWLERTLNAERAALDKLTGRTSVGKSNPAEKPVPFAPPPHVIKDAVPHHPEYKKAEKDFHDVALFWFPPKPPT